MADHSRLSRTASAVKGVSSRFRQISVGKPLKSVGGALSGESLVFEEEADRRAIAAAVSKSVPPAQELPPAQSDTWTALGLGRQASSSKLISAERDAAQPGSPKRT
eukprot:3308732-Prymnesium_polylepis.1